MRRLYYIAFVVCLTACGSTSDIPLDDAYIWPDKTPAKAVSAPATPVETETPAVTPATSSSPTLEFTNIQDTTITVKIKR